jgi:hypothetical protein
LKNKAKVSEKEKNIMKNPKPIETNAAAAE